MFSSHTERDTHLNNEDCITPSPPRLLDLAQLPRSYFETIHVITTSTSQPSTGCYAIINVRSSNLAVLYGPSDGTPLNASYEQYGDAEKVSINPASRAH
jgi:hypothetical protein